MSEIRLKMKYVCVKRNQGKLNQLLNDQVHYCKDVSYTTIEFDVLGECTSALGACTEGI